MSTRNVVFAVVGVFLVAIAFLMLLDVARHGITPMAIVSLVVVAFLAVAVGGAFSQPPRR